MQLQNKLKYTWICKLQTLKNPTTNRLQRSTRSPKVHNNTQENFLLQRHKHQFHYQPPTPMHNWKFLLPTYTCHAKNSNSICSQQNTITDPRFLQTFPLCSYYQYNYPPSSDPSCHRLHSTTIMHASHHC